MSRTEFTNYLKKRRERLGLNQTDVAGRMGYSQQYIVRWEAGDVRHITEEHLRKWARALETDAPTLRRLLGRDAPAPTGAHGRDRSVRELLKIPEIADGPERRLIQQFAETLIENQGPALLAVFRQWEREVTSEVDEADRTNPVAG